MRRETKYTLLYALLLGTAAAAAPFLALLPVFSGTAVAQITGPSAASGALAASEAATTPLPSPRSQTEPAAPEPPAQAQTIKLYDKDSGTVMEVSALDYMVGAVACEMPADWPDGALCAQMVASHTYALYAAEHGGGTNGAALDINRAQCSGWTDAEVLKARWGDTYEENAARLRALAEKVENKLLLYKGKPAAAFYHAVSSGRTESSENVWTQALPYLQGVDSAWDRYSEDYEVTLQFTQQQIADALQKELGLTPEGEPDTWFDDFVWDKAGYVKQITVCGQRFAGTQLRYTLGLRSACFAIAWRDNVFVITTRGYGHGVGLSQYGAYSMAQGGANWKQILEYYYPGTEVAG